MKHTRKRSRKRRRTVGAADARGARRRSTPTSKNSHFIDDTLQFWQPRARKILTREDAREIIDNVVGFFSILQEWDLAERESMGTFTSSPLLGTTERSARGKNTPI